MESESHSSSEENDIQDKQEHIKQRLKDLGVSEESERPKKSWFKKYGNYSLIIVVAVLAIAYWFEYKKQNDHSVQQVAQESTAVKQVDHLNLNYPASQPDYSMPQGNQKYTWAQQNAMQQKRMQQAWEQQKIRQQAWRKRVIEQQEKDRLAWQQWMKQQQSMRQRAMPGNGVNTEGIRQYNRNPYYARVYPFRPGYMQSVPNGVNQSQRTPYNVPYPRYNQITPDYRGPYYNGWQGY